MVRALTARFASSAMEGESEVQNPNSEPDSYRQEREDAESGERAAALLGIGHRLTRRRRLELGNDGTGWVRQLPGPVKARYIFFRVCVRAHYLGSTP